MVYINMEKVTMKKKISTLLSGKPILLGTVGVYYNVCGKTPCRCKDKDNPQKHGPYYQLSYSLKGKNSSIRIKPEDVDKVRQMTDNYRQQVSNVQDLGLELLEIYKNEGCDAMVDKFETLFAKEVKKKAGLQPDSTSLTREKKSKAKWKEKAIDRQLEISKLKVKVADTAKGRDNWKKKYQEEKAERKKAEEEIITLKKELKEKEECINELNKKKAKKMS